MSVTSSICPPELRADKPHKRLPPLFAIVEGDETDYCGKASYFSAHVTTIGVVSCPGTACQPTAHEWTGVNILPSEEELCGSELPSYSHHVVVGFAVAFSLVFLVMPVAYNMSAFQHASRFGALLVVLLVFVTFFLMSHYARPVRHRNALVSLLDSRQRLKPRTTRQHGSYAPAWLSSVLFDS